MEFKQREDFDIKFPELNLQELFGKWWKYVLLGLVAIWLLSGILIVDAYGQGVVRRFVDFSRTTPSALNYHFPWPIESVEKPKITQLKRVEIGFRTVGYEPQARYQQVPNE